MADGHLNFCKECKRAEFGKYRTQHLKEIRQYDRDRAKTEKRKRARLRYLHKSERSRVSRNLASQRHLAKRKTLGLPCHREMNPVKARARHVVENEIRRSRVRRNPCQVCGNPKTHGHHSDHTKALEVVWLCPRHHSELHRKHVEDITVPLLQKIREKMDHAPN